MRSEPTPTRGLAYSYPLRGDFMAQLVLPYDLTDLEAKRLGAFLLSLANLYAMPLPAGLSVREAPNDGE
jgi:hypothetical protein